MNESIKSILSEFIKSYAQRDKNIDFSCWLKDKLKQEIPDMDDDSCEKTADEIINAIAKYDKILEEVDSAKKQGYSKEDWLRNRIHESISDMPNDEKEKILQQMELNTDISNVILVEGVEIEDIDVNDIDIDDIEFDKFTLDKKEIDISQKIGFMGMAAITSALQKKLENNEIEISDAVKEALKDGLQSDTSEVKAVVAGAVKAAAEKKINKLAPDMPIEYIGSISGAAVESTKAVFDAASGNIPIYEVPERVGKSFIAAGGSIAKSSLKEFISCIPLVGPIVADLAGGLLDHLESPQFINDVYTTVKNTAKAAWEGIKNSKTVKAVSKAAKTVKNKVKNAGKKIKKFLFS